MNSSSITRTVSSIAIMCSAHFACAQSSNQDSWQTSLGLAAIYSPSYLGDDDYQLTLRPDLRVTYGDSFFASVATGIGYNVVNTENWKAGPIIRYNFGREEDGDTPFRILGDETDDLRGLGDIDDTIELGIFAEYSFQQYKARIEARQGVNGHEGLIGHAEINYTTRLKLFSRQAAFTIGPKIHFGNSNYNSEYFDVDASQSAASGLAQYDADGGINSYGIHASLALPLNDQFSLFTFAGYDRLVGDIEDSSLVRERGSENQARVGMFVSYKF